MALEKPEAQMRWSTVSTIKETVEDTLEFVAYHLVLGAEEVFLYFDDPEDKSFGIVSKHPRVKATICDDDCWGGDRKRPVKHEARQKANARHAYTKTKADWIIHLDGDEFVDSDIPVGQMLAGTNSDVLRLPPFEHLSFSKSGQNGRPSHIFRGALPNTNQGRRIAKLVYGDFYKCLNAGMLSHVAGKHFVRTGIKAMNLSIHGPFLEGNRAPVETAARARLLHLHGGDYTNWRNHVIRRLSSGAYMPHQQKGIIKQYGKEATLGHVLDTLIHEKGEEGLKEFHDAVCVFSPQKRALRRVGKLYKTNLWLSEKREDIFGEAQRF
ncbi:MAG: glycosyltransferase family 2 protein, partial [Marinosulfonomonas sp.]|nr:glycosyltransferase family 2 protein [Marinosulfonomonas sp.]